MRRRDFMAGSVATAALGAAGWPVYAEINAGSPVPKRIALVHLSLRPEQLTSSSGRRTYKAYFQELDRLGYIEGKNLIVERYSVLGRHDRTEEIARAAVSSRPDLIIAFSGALTRALKPLTTTIPILAITGDPVAGGIVTSMAKPGGNITGVSTDAGFEIYSKRLQSSRYGQIDADDRKSGSAASDEMPRLKTGSTIGLHFACQRLILWACEDAFLRRKDTVRGGQLALSLRGVRI